MLSRRELLRATGQTLVALPFIGLVAPGSKDRSMRCVNVVNFIRGVEPRFTTDLLLPVQNQMELVLKHDLPATWLLQYDALVSGQFVSFLKQHMPPSHEVGTWFEMNEMHCRDAGVKWRGRPGYEWDHLPFVAFSIGYSKEERILLADTAMRKFHDIWGHYPKSVASWNLDSWTIAHLVEHYQVEAFAVCRDQIATDGFTIWGSPIAGYYPSKRNCWSPATESKNQISAPVFRMLGQDPVYYYDRVWKMPDGQIGGFPDTMEPVWPSGQSKVFVDRFLAMIEDAPSEDFAYLQMGQENSFPWDQQGPAYPYQMEALAAVRSRGKVHVETMSATGRRFKAAFQTTPAQAQVQLKDPYGKEFGGQESIWFQSRFYRANLHIREGHALLRDITVYRDDFAQPFIDEPTRDSFVEQRLLAVMDGYHWSEAPGDLDRRTAGAYLRRDGRDLSVVGTPVVESEAGRMRIGLPLANGTTVLVEFGERGLAVSGVDGLSIGFEFDSAKSSFRSADASTVHYRWQDFDYSVRANRGRFEASESGFVMEPNRSLLELSLAGESVT